MKKYIIKYADGSEQIIMQGSYKSRNEASDALMQYVSAYNEGLNIDSDDYLSPFDFKLEEVECKEVNEVITDFESARKALGLKSNVDFEPLGCFDKFDDIVQLISDINPKHIEALIAQNKLFTIADAWNKEDGFIPNFSNWEQDNWSPWFEYDSDAARFTYVNTGNTSTAAPVFGSHLCFKTSERAAQFGKQFVDLYNKVFL